MATNVLLLHYNNYFNRRIKKLDTVAEYKSADTNYADCTNINFVPGDGVVTTLVLGYGTNPSNLFTDTKIGYDYLVVYDSTTVNDSTTYTVLSRWFIMEAHRTRSKQYELVLKRDVIADNYTNILESPIYLEKGYINSTANPLLYNSESLALNQIKQYEIPLKDKTECGWVVGYIPRDSFSESTTVESSAIFTQNADITVTNLASWSY